MNVRVMVLIEKKGLIIPLTHVLSRDGGSVVARVSFTRTFRGSLLACGQVDRLVFKGSFYKGLCIRPSHFFYSAVSSFLMGKNQGKKRGGLKLAGKKGGLTRHKGSQITTIHCLKKFISKDEKFYIQKSTKQWLLSLLYTK